MRRLLFGFFPCLFTLLIVFLFGIGIVRFDTENQLLRSVDSHAGFLYQVLPSSLHPRARNYFDQASTWLGSPCVTPTSNTTAHTPGIPGKAGGPGEPGEPGVTASRASNPLY